MTAIIDSAFKLNETGDLSDDGLISILEQLINATAMDNGYADEYGLPFPRTRGKRGQI